MAKKYEVLKDFDYSPNPGVVMVFKKGEVRSGLTRACIEKGKSQEALKPLPHKGDD